MMTVLPQGWAVIYGFGIRQIQTGDQSIPANVSLGQDDLAAVEAFDGYLKSQVKMIEETLTAPKIAGPQPTAFPDCDEARLMLVMHTPPGFEPLIHVQTYVRIGLWVGIVTLTASQEQLKNVRPYSDQFTQGLRVLPENANAMEAQPASPVAG